MSDVQGAIKLYRYLLNKKTKIELNKIFGANNDYSKKELVNKIVEDIPVSQIYTDSLNNYLEWYEKLMVYALRDGAKQRKDIYETKGYQILFDVFNINKNQSNKRLLNNIHLWSTKSLRKAGIVSLDGEKYSLDSDVQQYMIEQSFSFENLKNEVLHSNKKRHFPGSVISQLSILKNSPINKGALMGLVIIVLVITVSLWGINYLLTPKKLSFDDTEHELDLLVSEMNSLMSNINYALRSFSVNAITKHQLDYAMMEYLGDASDLSDKFRELEKKAHPDFEKCLEYYASASDSIMISANMFVNENYDEAVYYMEDATMCIQLAETEYTKAVYAR